MQNSPEKEDAVNSRNHGSVIPFAHRCAAGAIPVGRKHRFALPISPFATFRIRHRLPFFSLAAFLDTGASFSAFDEFPMSEGAPLAGPLFDDDTTSSAAGGLVAVQAALKKSKSSSAAPQSNPSSLAGRRS